MANNKKFIVKNGLLTTENVVIGDTLDRSTGRLQVKHDTGSNAARFDGVVVFDHDVASQAAIQVTNDATNGIIASFTGTGGDLRLQGIGTGDYFLYQSNQNNGIKFFDGNDGVQFWYSNQNYFEVSSAGADFKVSPTYNGNTIWHEANDGAGSGLDADLLDGLDSLQFLRSDEDDTFDGNLIITGDLTVNGDTTYVNTEQLLVSDNIFTLNADFTSGTPSENSGMEIRRGDQANSSLLWDETNDWWKLNSAGVDLGRIITTADEGDGNGFDADQVDGLDAWQFIRSDVADTANGAITFNADLIIDQQIVHKGDTNTYLDFNAADSFQVVTGGTARLTVANASVTGSVDFVAPRFVDADNNSYFANPAGTSTFNDLGIDDDLFHNGDTDTKLSFATDTINLATGGTNRLTVNNTSVTSSVNVYGPRYYDSDNNAYYVDPAGDSQLNTIDIDDYIRHRGDTNNYFGFAANDTFRVWTGGTQRLNIDTDSADFTVSVYAPVYYDSNNNGYYVDPDSTSVVNSININDYIRHNGDTTTFFGFPTNDSFRVYTNNVQRFNVDNDSADFAVNVYGPRYYDSNNTAYYGDFASTSQMSRIDIDDYIRHRGDLDTYVGFDTANRFTVVTGGTWRVRVDNDSVDFNVNAYAPNVYASRYYDADNNAYYVDPNGDSQMNTIDIDDYIRHRGDTNTYIGFDANDQFAAWTNNTKRFNISSTGLTNIYYRTIIGNSLTRPDSLADLTDSALKVGGSDVHLHVASLSATGNYAVALQSGRESDNASFPMSLQPNGNNVGVGTLTPDARVSITSAAAVGANPFAAGNKLISLKDNGTTKTTWSLDSSGANWIVSDADSDFVFSDSGATIALGVNTGSGDVVVGDQSPQYTDGGDNTPLVGTNSAAKLHVNGSIYLNGSNDAIIFGRGTSSFLKDEELAFGWGGGLYMTDSTYLRIRNNKAVYSTGTAYFSRVYDTDNTSYYTDPASTSIMNDIGLDDRIEHNGDTDTYIQFHNANEWRVVTGGSERLEVINSYVKANNQMRSPIFYDLNDTAYYGDFASTSQMNRIDINDYIRHRGDTNTYMGFDANDRWNVWTNGVKRLQATAGNVKIRNKLYVYGAQASSGDAALFQSNANGGGVTIRFSDQNSGEDVAPSQSGTIGFYHQDNSVNPDSNAAFYFRTTEPKSHFIFGSESDGAGTSATDYVAIVPDVNNVGWVGRADRRWANIYGITGNFSGNTTAANMYASRYYDADNNAYYMDPASTSITNVMRANRYEVDGSTYFIDSASGSYGSIRVEGQRSSWAGYAIYDDWVFMSNGTANAGIYNDTRNEWAMQAADNSWTRLYANGVHQISAENGYGYAPSSMRSPIFYDSNNTSYFANFYAGNTSRAFRIRGIYYRDGFDTGSNGDNNKLLEAQDYSHWIWNTATNWGIFWAGNNNAAYSHFGSSNPNELTFVGAGNTRASIDLDNGNAWFQGQVDAANFAVDGGNEAISLLPSYGAGTSERKLFDGNLYWEKRAIQALRGNENSPTGSTGEYVKSTNAPGSSSYVLRTSAYRDFYSDYIEVEPGEEIYGEIYVRRISGSGGVLYYGIERFDKDKRAIAGNTGTTYFVASNVNVTSTSWTKYSGHTTIPTSHTAYSGSDGGGVRYVRIRLLMNYSGGGALREFTAPILQRTNVQGRLRTDQNIYAARYYDINNTSYYADPASTSYFNDMRANIYYDRNNTAYYMNPASGGKLAGSWDWTNGSIENLNNLSFNDPGPQEGIRWKGGNDWKIYEAPNNMTNTGGNLHFTTGSGNGTMRMRIESDGDVWAGRYMYATRFIDSNNTSYYVDPADSSTSANLRGSIKINGDNNEIWMDMDSASNGYARIRMGGYAGDPFIEFSDASNNSGQDQVWAIGADDRATGSFVIRFNGSTLFPADWTSAGTERFQLRHDGNLSLSAGEANSYRLLVGGTGYASSDFRAPIFYDSNDTGYYVNPNGTSRMEKIRFEGSDEAIEMNGTNPYIRWMENGTDRAYIQWRSDYNAPLFRNQQGDDFWFHPHASTGAVRIRLGGSDFDDWGSVYAADDQEIGFLDDQGNWAIRHNRDSWTYFYINNSLRAYVDTGSLQHVSSMQAPIYYDRNNTAYYGDFASTSRMNVINANMYSLNDGWDIYDDDADTLSIRSNNSDHGEILFRDSGDTVTGRIYFDDDNHWGFKSPDDEWQIYLERNARTILYYNGGQQARTQNGYFEANNQMRAPIYYDSNNTFYYVNPASTSRINGLDVRGTTNLRSTVYSDGIFYIDNPQDHDNTVVTGLTNAPLSTRNRDYNVGTTDAFLPFFHQTALYNSGYRTHMNLGLFKRASGWGNNNTGFYVALGGNDSYPTMHWKLTYGTDIYNSNNYVSTPGSFRAPIFYDSNNTGYYANPASRSNFYQLDIRNEQRMIGGAPLYFYTSSGNLRGYIRATESNDSHFEFATSGNEDIIFRDGGFGGSWNQIIRGNGQVLISGRLDVPIMYDSNNTGYYVDPAGFSNLNSGLRATEIYARNWFRNDNSGEGIYNQATAMHWYSDTNRRWRLYSTQSTAEILFTTSGNNARGYVYANNSNEIGFLNQSGSWSLRTNSSVVYSYRNFYAPIMYDTNDTSYYVNPNGTSRLRRINLTEELQLYSTDLIVNTIKFRNRSGGTNSDPMMLRFVERGSNQSHLEFQLNDDSDEDLRIYGYSCAGYGCGEVSGNLYHWFRSNGDAWHRSNLYADGSMRSPIFYDSNNTGYYTNPASTSSMNTITADRFNARDRGDWITFYGNDSDYHAISARNSGGSASDDIRINSYNNVFINLDSNNNNGTAYLYVGRHGAGTGSIQGWYFQAGDDGNTYASSSFRAPIFYDRDNTGYYVNPSDFSNLNTGVRANEFYARNWFRNDNSGEGIYNQATTQHFYSDSDDGWNVAGGGSANWIRMRDEYGGTVRGYFYAESNNSVGILNYAGSWRLRIVSGDYMLYYGSSIRAPLYYDSNNTSYYMDPASTSRMNYMRLSSSNSYLKIGANASPTTSWDTNRPQLEIGQNHAYPHLTLWSYGTNTTHGGVLSFRSRQGSGFRRWNIGTANYNPGNISIGWYDNNNNPHYGVGTSWSYPARWWLDTSGNNYVTGSFRAPIFYDSNNTGYYANPASTSSFNDLRSNQMRYRSGVSANNTYGMYFDSGGSTAYAIYREGGSWSYPYPDVRVAFHTGLKFGANPSYGGMRFYTDYNMASRVMQVNGGSNYIYMDRWVNVTGYQGIYSGTNSAHFYPNNGDYGSWRIDGTRNGWYGIYFASGSTLMMNSNDGGIHRSGNGWRIYHSGNNLYARGNVTAYWSDRRLKQNFQPLTRGEGLDIIDRLVPTAFEWNALAVEVNDHFTEGQPETALIAQEVQEVIPDAVRENKAGRKAGKDSSIESYLTIDYDKITPFIIAAVKDLKEELADAIDEIKQLKDEIAQLKGEK